MPAKSKAQQAYMAIAEHDPSKLRGPMPNMTHQQLHDFAATPVKNKPEHVETRHPHKNLKGYLHKKKAKAAPDVESYGALKMAKPKPGGVY